MYRIGVFLLCAIVVCACALPLVAAEPKRILILNSYDPGYQWTDDETSGARAGLKKANGEVKVYVEYMGAKLVNDREYIEHLRQLYRHKYEHVHLDAIISTDNDAFEFLRAHRDEVFGPVPTVFCGVNYLNIDDLKGTTLFTGVSETIDVAGNFDLILRLHPKTKHIAVITDDSITGKRIHQEVADAIPNHANRLQVTFLENIEFSQLLDKVAKLPSDTVIFYSFYFRDSTGKVFDYYDSASMVSNNSHVPVYGAWDFNLGHGIIGGKLTSGFEQGETAGQMAARILNGENVESMPVQWSSTSQYMFDFVQLNRFGIPSEKLPSGSIIINQPPSSYEINKRLVWGVLCSVVALTIALAVLLANIFRRRRAEQALRESERQLSNIIEFLPDATLVTDKNRKVIAWNRAMQEITGVRQADIVGREFTSALPMLGERSPHLIDLLGAKNPETLGLYENFREQGSTLMGEVYLPSAFQGRGAYLWAIASPLQNSEGKLTGAIESIRDVTDRKQAELDVLEMQEQLRQAAKMEAVGQLAGGIAHDFNNQLTVVQGYCSLLMAKLAPNDPARDLVDEIVRAADRSSQLTSQLLAFSRKQILHPTTLDLREVLANLRGPLSRMIGETVRIEADVAHEVWPVDVDRNQLEQAIMNLAINARDAMPEGGTLKIALHNTVLNSDYVMNHADASNGPHVVLSVSDSGVGMDEEMRRRIFEPFFTTKGVGKGTGLGLPMVYGFVKQSGGHLDVASEPGKGTCFNLYFPPSAGTVEGSSTAPQASQKGTETILVVEDDNALRELVVHVLETGGYRVLQACDGASGIELNREYEGEIDLVLCDVVMPEMSGPNAVKQIRLDRPGLKVIFVTGYTEKPVPDQPNTYCLNKPFTPETLFRFIRQVLDEDHNRACA
jgi:PAS domain S-box-containing protein